MDARWACVHNKYILTASRPPHAAYWQWCRYVVKYAGSGSFRSSYSNCFRCLEKLVLPSVCDTSFSSLMMWNISFQWQNVTFLEVKTYYDPSYIFSSGQDPPNPQDLCPCLRVVCSHPAQISTDSSTPCFPPFSIRLMVSFITVDTYINCCRSVEPTTIRHSGIRLYRLSGKLSIKRVYRVVAL